MRSRLRAYALPMAAIGTIAAIAGATGTAVAAPANDRFADAAALAGAGPFAVAADSSAATVEAGEDAVDAEGGASVWWKWTAPRTGTVDAWTCLDESGIDTVLSVHAGRSIGGLRTLDESDDADGVPPGATCEVDSAISFDATAGSTYVVRVADYDEAGGPFVLRAGYRGGAPDGPGNLAPELREAPAISGRVRAGSIVQCRPGAWLRAERLALQWRLDGRPVPGATHAALKLAAGMAGHALECEVAASNGAGSMTAQSAPRAVAQSCVVPDVRGLAVRTARSVLARRHCRASVRLRGRAGAGRPARVVRVSPAPRQVLSEWATVQLVAARSNIGRPRRV